MDKQIESTAYHEAAHIVAAVAQRMPIRPAGIDLDLCGNGCAYYFHREAGDLTSSPKDEKERKRTVIALYAAHRAQRKFYPESQERGWTHDLHTIKALVREMYQEETGHLRTILQAILPTVDAGSYLGISRMLKHSYRELRSAYVHSAQTEWREFAGAYLWQDVTDADEFWRKELPFVTLSRLDLMVRDFIIFKILRRNELLA